MKNWFLLFTLLTLSLIVSAQKYNGEKQKENITFPELLVFTNEFENYFSIKNKVKKIVSGKHFLEGPVWVEALNGLLFTD